MAKKISGYFNIKAMNILSVNKKVNNISNNHNRISFKSNDESGSYDSFGVYRNEIKKYKRISRKEEIELSQEIKKGGESGRKALNKLVLANLLLVVDRATKRKEKHHSKMDIMDLIQEGNNGLYKAALRYNGANAFSTYAVAYIDGYMKVAEYYKHRIIRLPVGVINDIDFLNKKISELEQKLSRKPTIDEISVGTKLSKKKIENLLKNSSDAISLYEKIYSDNNDDKRLIDIISEENIELPYEYIDRKIMEENINSMLNLLNEKQRKILISRFGLFGAPVLLQKEIAKDLNISYQAVQKHIKNALDMLKQKAPKLLTDLKEESFN